MNKKTLLVSLLSLGLLVSCGPSQTDSKPVESSPAGTSVAAPESTADTTPAESKPAESKPAESKPAESKPAESKPAESTSEAPEVEATVTFSAIDMITESNKAMIKISGTMTGIPAAAQKMAVSIAHAASEGIDDGTGGYVLGSETPAAEDYKLAPTVSADGTFELKVDVSEVPFVAGAYKVFAGPKDHYIDVTNAITGQNNGSAAGSQFGGGKAKANGNRLYFRDDLKLLMADKLPPVSLTKAYVEEGTGEDKGKAFLYIGGELGIAEDEFIAKDPFLQFQEVGGSWGTTRMDTQEGMVSCVVIGGEGFVKVNITGLSEGKNYNTHLNIDDKKQADCKMENDLDTRSTPAVIGTKAFAVFCNTAGTSQTDFWGNLAIIVTHVHAFARAESKVEGTDMYKANCTCSTAAYEMDVDSTVCPGIGADLKMSGGKGATFNITGIQSGEYEVYAKAHVTSGNETADKTVGMSTGEQLDETRGGTAVPGRYYAQVGDGNKVYTDTGDKNFNQIGWNDATKFLWSNEAVIPSIMIAGDSTSFTFKHTGAGYSIYLESIRLVRKGNYMAPPKTVVFDEQHKCRIEAEDAHAMTGGSANLAITSDAARSGGKYVAGFDQWKAKLQYNVVVTEEVSVKFSVAYLYTNGQYGAYEFYLDGTEINDRGDIKDVWSVHEFAEATTLTAGAHTIALQVPYGTSAAIDYIEIVQQISE